MTYLFYSMLIIVIMAFGSKLFGEKIIVDNHWNQFIIDRGLEQKTPMESFLTVVFMSLIPIIRWTLIATLVMMISVDYYDIKDELEGR